MINKKKAQVQIFSTILLLMFVTISSAFVTNDTDLEQNHFPTEDGYGPSVTINFAGNLSDSGGPYWRPPGESVQLSGVWFDGYYTNNSRQSESWIYINLTVSDTDGVDEVWLHWLNETTWTNDSYEFINTAGDYWEFNSNENITNTKEGFNYSFDIWANDTSNNVNITAWNKTTIGGGYTRRYIQLNCNQINISYIPLYFFNTENYSASDENRYDRLHHDQGTDGSTVDTGYLLEIDLNDTVNYVYCSSFIGFWFDSSISIIPITLKNIYFHLWISGKWSDDIVLSKL